MTGWAQQVKDPSFALDVLDLLRTQDSRWRLRLLGSGLPTEAWSLEVAERVERGLADGALEQPGQVEDVYSYLAPAAHVLNTSLREGCPTAVIEAVWAGCLPVVRDWPVYAAHRGAASTLPCTRIVVDPGEAAEALRANAEAVMAGDGEGLAAWVRHEPLSPLRPGPHGAGVARRGAGQRVPEPGQYPVEAPSTTATSGSRTRAMAGRTAASVRASSAGTVPSGATCTRCHRLNPWCTETSRRATYRS